MHIIIRKAAAPVFFLVLLFILSPLVSTAQRTIVPPEAAADSTTTWLITTMDDNDFYGPIVERTFKYIALDTESLGRIEIPLAQIKRMEAISESRIVNGVFWPDNPLASRYFVGVSGHNLRPGDGYYQNVWIFFNQLAFGINDYSSIGFGVLSSFFLGGGPVPVWITPKVSVPLGGPDGLVHVGVGSWMGTIIGEDTAGSFGVGYGTLTFGSRDKNISLGLGRQIFGSEADVRPTFSINAMGEAGASLLCDSGNLVLGRRRWDYRGRCHGWAYRREKTCV